MPNFIDANGLTVETYDEYLTFFTTGFQEIYGDDINLESDTPDGQMVNLFIQAIQDVLDLVVQVYNSFDPDNAVGVVLDQRVAINGIQRQAGTYTLTAVQLVISKSLNLYGLDQDEQPVYTVADNAGNNWLLTESQLGVSIGTHSYTFRAENPGAVLTIPNTITVPVTIVLGVDSINNPTSYLSLGINEESDAVLKVRRQKSVSLASQGYLKGLLAALENINGVTGAFVYENETAATSDGTNPPDVPSGIPSHSIWVIVAGTASPALAVAWSSVTNYAYGDLASSGGNNYISIQASNLNNLVSDTLWWAPYDPIAQAIYAKRNGGCGMKGTETYSLTQINGVPIVIRYDFVSSETLFTKFTARSLNKKTPPNIAAIRSGLVTAFVPGVAEEVNVNALATAVQSIDPNCLVSSAGFSTTSGGAYTDTLSPSDATKQFQVTEADIIIIAMILAGAAGETGIGYNINSTTGVVTNTTLSIANGGNTFTFQALGGFGSYTYSIVGSGSVNATTGVYTSNAAGTDTVTATDGLGNTASCVITVT
jgi:hypothetical protein